MKIKILLLLAITLFSPVMATHAASISDYAVVVSTATEQDRDWAKVVAALKKKHHATVIAVADPFGAESRAKLQSLHPRYVAFVARPEEIDVKFVQQIHVLSRSLDNAPYMDFMWGIITGVTPDVALRIASVQKPLIVHRALSTTGINLDPLDDSLTLSDGKAGDFVLQTNGQVFHGNKTSDPISAHERYLNYYNRNDVDLLVSSSHATEVNLEMPFRDGSIVISGAQMFMVDKTNLFSFIHAAGGQTKSGLWYQSPGSAERRAMWAATNGAPELRHTTNPKIYLAAGNCLIGDAMGTSNSLVMDWLSYQGVNQFIGYTVPTWFGKGGWGVLELWQDYGGQYNLAEVFFLNQQRIIHKLATEFPAANTLQLDGKTMDQLCGEDSSPATVANASLTASLNKFDDKQHEILLGYLYDRDVLAFYGDPKWDARLDATKAGSQVKWHWSGPADELTLTIECVKDFKKSELLILLPTRMKNVQATSADGLTVTVNDEFIWIANPDFTARKTYQIKVAPPKS